MARGQKESADSNLQMTNQAAGGEQATRNSLMAPFSNRAGSMFGLAAPIIQQMTQRPGYSDATKSNMRNDVFGGVNSAYDATQRNAQNRVARTGNGAGAAEMEGDLARSRARDLGSAAGGLDTQFANEETRQKEAGAGLANDQYKTNTDAQSKIYGVGSDAFTKLLGLGPSTLNSRAAGGGWAQGFKDVFGTLFPNGA